LTFAKILLKNLFSMDHFTSLSRRNDWKLSSKAGCLPLCLIRKCSIIAQRKTYPLSAKTYVHIVCSLWLKFVLQCNKWQFTDAYILFTGRGEEK